MSGLSVLAHGLVPAWINIAAEILGERADLADQAIECLGGSGLDPVRRHAIRGAVLELVGRGVEFQFKEGDSVLWAELRSATEAAIASARAHAGNLKHLGHVLTESRLLEYLPGGSQPTRSILEQISRAGIVGFFSKSAIVDSLEDQIAALNELLAQAPIGKAGRRSVAHDFVGNWKSLYVVEAGKTFVAWRPKKLKTTVDGSFHQFASVAFELLTGEPPDEEGVGLKRYIEYAVPRIQELAELQANEKPLSFAAERQDGFDDVLDEVRERIAEIERELEYGPKRRRS